MQLSKSYVVALSRKEKKIYNHMAMNTCVHAHTQVEWHTNPAGWLPFLLKLKDKQKEIFLLD